MKVYIQFLTTGTKGNIIEKLGSDGVFMLDGRQKLSTWVKDGHDRAYMLRHVSHLVGFKVMVGSRFDNSYTVHEEIF